MPIRSFLFEIFIYVWGMIIPVIYSLAFLTGSSKIADKGAYVWAKFSIWVLKVICGITFEVRGRENLPASGGFIVACKHQSMWETLVMHLVFHRPVYAYKVELLKIPFYGWFVAKMSGIAVDRKGGAKALKDLVRNSKDYLEKGQKVILFPQGTRVPVGKPVENYPYQAGIKALYSQLDYPVVPAALNSGKCYPKNLFGKKKGSIILEFLPPIDPKTDRKEFMGALESAIEKKSQELI
jgi:1-acyl-sn-glycerol-3-phosphate acyltransferase